MTIRRYALTCLLLLSVAATGPATSLAGVTAPPPVIRTTDQGLHHIGVAGGQLTVVIGTYQNTQVYKRSLSAYFQRNGESKLNLVPIVESEVDYTTEWFNLSRGETTLADAALVSKGSSVNLIIVDRSPEKNVFTVKRYLFREAGNDYPDGPGMLFVPQSSKTLSSKKSDSVESVLKREIASVR